MSPRGLIIRARVAQPEAARTSALEQLGGAIRALPAAAGVQSITHEHETDLLVAFGIRASAHEAWSRVTEAAASAGVPAEVCVWTGPPGTTVYGDHPALSQRLVKLIANGMKTAGCGALADYIADGVPPPVEGETFTVIDYAGRPALRYRVTEVRIMPFSEVSESFASGWGEGDFAAWRSAHAEYFARTCGFHPQMMVVCECFQLLEVLG